jgi:uncharacterized protein YecE (DUF72 family)
MQILAGTSGYSYKEWCGTFYPPKLAAAKMLAYYATKLPVVEINNTFYRLPQPKLLESWREQVPPDFRFVIKASRRITHIKRIGDVASETAYLLETISSLGEQLGAVLFQLPPYMRCDLPRLDAFLDLLPAGTSAAFEFRHDSWNDDAVRASLAAHGCAVCASDTDEGEEPALAQTAPFVYLRLRREGYEDAALGRWLERLHAGDWERAYVFFKHEDGAVGPRLAERFLEMAGVGAGPGRSRL